MADLEKDIEKKATRLAVRSGWLSYKWSSPGHNSVPDRIFIHEGTGTVAFIEFKRVGKSPTPLQERTLSKLDQAGANVCWSDNAEDAVQWLNGLLETTNTKQSSLG